MSARRTAEVASGMEQTRRRLEHWRKTRRAGRPMPEALWSAAIRLAQRHGAYPTARALGLEYNKLKRLSDSTGHPPQGRSAPTFVELIAPPPVGGSECRIEMEGPGGGRMRITLALAHAEVLLSLCRMVWSGAA